MKNHFVGLNADFFGFVASMLCVIHCLCVPFIVTLMPLVGAAFLEDPRIEIGLILTSLIITGYAFRRNFKGAFIIQLPIVLASVGFLFIFIGSFASTEVLEISVKAVGVVLVCIAHVVNWRAMHRK